MIVADNSLIAYFFIKEPMSGVAEAVFRKDPDWAAPAFWRSEFRSVLWKAVRRGDIAFTDALVIIQDAEDLFWGREFRVESGPVLSLAHTSGCSPYNCEYVHLAQELDVRLVTDDRKVLAAFPGTAISMQAFGS
ncbi:MAG TPA: type II toxin-antitoxin system VapC family toxin [Longimicrobium sp.]|nr:type II toxin-antitoxin system VapC family toxin [Longimicrobium sp.]